MNEKSLIPKTAKKLDHKIVREGEHTGHMHRATAEDVTLFIDGDWLFMMNPSGTNLVHEEHNTLWITPGEKQSGAVREFDHFLEEARDVMD